MITLLRNEQVQEVVGSLAVVFLTRYLMELSTPEKDWAMVQSWLASFWYLKFYRGVELRRQLVGMRMIRDALTHH